jgi:hypothetical protein
MDPDAALAEIRALSRQHEAGGLDGNGISRMAELIGGLA